MADENRQVVVVKRASGIPTADVFAIIDGPMPECPPHGVLVKVLYAAVDPGMRGWLSAERNYMTVADGDVMRALAVGEVLESASSEWQVGDALVGWFGWQQYAAVPASAVLWQADTAVAPAEAWLGVFGYNGLTAWVGLQHLGRPASGETVLVSTAAGGVGGTVGQLAHAGGLRAVGLTSSDEKVALATAELGYAQALDYRAEPDLGAAIGRACPDGIDIFFDNTGGAIADAVFPHLNSGARVVQCGTAAVASWMPVPAGPRRERDVLVKRLSWHGFVILDHEAQFPAALAELKSLWTKGRLTARHHVIDGLAAAPGAIQLLYEGRNQGRLVIRI